MNTDTLTEFTYVPAPREADKLYAVRFTEWTQADTLRVLLGASTFDVAVTEGPDGLEFSAVFHWKQGTTVTLSRGDYLVTNDSPEEDPFADEPRPRIWRPMMADDMAAYERYRPQR